MGIKDDLSRYYKEIKDNLPCQRKFREIFLTEAHKLVNDFMQNKPDATYEDIVKSVGTPEELAETFLNTLADGGKIEKYLTARRKKKRIAIIALIITTVILFGVIVYIICIRHTTAVSEGTITIISQAKDVSSSITAS